MTRKIPPSSVNLFQLIYVLIREYTEKSGQPALNLSLGNPDGIPNEALRILKGRFAASSDFDAHTYAEDRNLNEFAEGMIQVHTHLNPRDYNASTHFLTTAGIKTTTAILPLACGFKAGQNFRVISCQPAYDMIGTWTGYLGGERLAWKLEPSEQMIPNLARLKNQMKEQDWTTADLAFVIRPGNPASVRAQKNEWRELIEFCIERKIRLVNDAAYLGLSGPDHVCLAKIAIEYPELEWMELYSVSKSFNDPGARLGAAWGSKDFIEDLRLIKGNTDSGPNPSTMMAYGEYFKNTIEARNALQSLRTTYDRRVEYITRTFEKAGLKRACDTSAGFFTLWLTPKKVLGKLVDGNSEAFNRLVISETGIVGVHFPGGIMRYAVCTDVFQPEFQRRFEAAVSRLEIEY